MSYQVTLERWNPEGSEVIETATMTDKIENRNQAMEIARYLSDNQDMWVVVHVERVGIKSVEPTDVAFCCGRRII